MCRRLSQPEWVGIGLVPCVIHLALNATDPMHGAGVRTFGECPSGREWNFFAMPWTTATGRCEQFRRFGRHWRVWKLVRHHIG